MALDIIYEHEKLLLIMNDVYCIIFFYVFFLQISKYKNLYFGIQFY